MDIRAAALHWGASSLHLIITSGTQGVGGLGRHTYSLDSIRHHDKYLGVSARAHRVIGPEWLGIKRRKEPAEGDGRAYKI